jgi:hypothetical protein
VSGLYKWNSVMINQRVESSCVALNSGTKLFMVSCLCAVVVQNAVLVDANSYANVEDTDFIDNVGTGDQSLLQSTNSGALLELLRVMIEGNTGGRVSNARTSARFSSHK